MDLGREEGFRTAKEGTDRLMRAIKAKEDARNAKTTVSSAQTTPKTTTSISAQTDSEATTIRTTMDGHTQTDLACTLTSPPEPPQPITPPLSSPAQPLSPLPMLMTTVTNINPQTSIHLQTPRKRRDSMPSHLRTPQLSSQPPVTCPKPRGPVVTSSSTSVRLPAATTPQTTTQATDSAQATPTISETTYPMVNEVREPSDVGKAKSRKLRDDEQMYALERVVHPTERPNHTQYLVRGSRYVPTPSSPPQLDPRPHTSAVSTSPPPMCKNLPSSPCTTVPSHITLPITTSPHETRPTTPVCAQKQPKPPISNQNHTKSRKSLVLSENAMDSQDNTTYRMLFNPATLRDQATARTVDPYCLPAARSQPPASRGHGKGVPLGAVEESKLCIESPVSTTVAPALETRSDAVVFVKKHQKTEKTTYSTLKPPYSPVVDRFEWADDAEALPISPTFPQHPPRDLSCLRSMSAHPFSSLRRRRGRPRYQQNTQCRHDHPYTSPTWHAPLPVHLGWDDDPRLSDLSAALRALGWIRR
jgi:hypothetical protein